MDVSVCIVNWNAGKLLTECLSSIREKTAGLDYEVIVVDNASADGSPLMLRREHPWCVLIENGENAGFVKANNQALSRARGRYILYLNPDTALVTNAIAGMFRFLENQKKYGAAGCRLTYPGGKIQYTCASTFPTPFNELCELMFFNRLFPRVRPLSSRELDYWDHADSRDVDCLSGACMMVRREVAERLGGFDENIYMYCEDIDLCYRILEEGWSIYYLATEEITHFEGSSSGKMKNRNFASIMQKESNYYFLATHKGPVQARAYAAAVFAGSLFRMTLALAIAPLIAFSRFRALIPSIIGKYAGQLLWSLGLRGAGQAA